MSTKFNISNLRRLFGPARRSSRRPKRAAALPGCEALEIRMVPAAYIQAGYLFIDGTNAADVVTIRSANPSSLSSQIKVVENGTTRFFPRAAITTGEVHFRGYGGDDTFDAYTFAALRVVASGGTGNDTLSGGYLHDTLYGMEDNDTIYGQEGNDTIYGNDVVAAGDGLDFVFGGAGNDTLWGQAHDDHLYGEGDSDTLYGDDGNDTLYGDHGADPWGGTGIDTLYGGAGSDLLVGQGGNDTLHGQGDSDVLYGNDGHDSLYGDTWDGPPGSFGNDHIYGGAGNDVLSGEGGNDYLYGELGSDELYGREGNDVLYGDNWGNPWGDEGNDNLYGGNGDDTLHGEGGDDLLYGEGGVDRLYGGAGNDGLFGGTQDGRDSLNGGAGADRFLSVAVKAPPILEPIMDFVREDDIDDYGSQDARPTFLNGYKIDNDLGSYTAKDWSNDDVLRTDVVLAMLHREDRGQRLLERPDGGDLVIVRHGGTSRGFNDSKWIHMTDASNQYGDTSADDFELRGVVLHEIGHFWHGDGFGSARWTQFKNVSLWTDDDPEDTSYTRGLDEDEDWWHYKQAKFASIYARTNPREDFAESFSAYFSARAGWTFYNGSGADQIPLKMELFEDWHSSL